MDDFLQEKPKKQKTSSAAGGSRRLFVLVFAVAILWQVLSFVQLQLSHYHQALKQDFKIILPVVAAADNAQLQAWGESLNTKEDISSVKLFSPQDGLAVLQKKNPQLAQSMVALGREQMPAYFEVRLQDKAIANIDLFVRNLAAEYPQLTVKYAAGQARLISLSGLYIRLINMTVVLAFTLFLVFMFLVEAYPTQGKSHAKNGVWAALLAGGLSFVVLAVLLYPMGVLLDNLQQYTTLVRQIILLVFCGLFGWTLGKWQKF